MVSRVWPWARLLGAVSILVTLLVGLSLAPQRATARAAAPMTWTVLVGGEAGIEPGEQGPVAAWSFMRFYPAKLTVNVGDTIVFKQKSAELHTVTFLAPGQQPPAFVIPEGGGSQRLLFNPQVVFPAGGPTYDGTAYVNSGQMDLSPQTPKEFKLTFTKAGSFPYLCLIHAGVGPDGKLAGMVGLVTVNPAGTPYPQTQAQVDADAAQQLAADTQAAMQAEPAAKQVASRPGPNGTTIYDVNVGAGTMTMDWMRFGPRDLTIKVGDTVNFVQQAQMAPHTVTFTSGGAEPAFVLPEPQPNGPPKLVLNPQVLAPAGGKVYSGTGYFNSGFMPGTKDPAPGPRSYTLTFDKPGTYKYLCILHDQQGMQGQITVVANTMPGLPNTGGGAGAWRGAAGGLAALALGLLLGASVLWRRRRVRQAA